MRLIASRRHAAATGVLMCALLAYPAAAARAAGAAPPCGPTWTSSYLASQALPSAAPSFGDRENKVFADQTLRMVVSPHVAGSQVRLRLSNRWGTQSVRFDGVRIARQAQGAAVIAATSRKVTFGGDELVAVPAGGASISDPVVFPVFPFEHLAVTFHVVDGPTPLDVHPEANQQSYLSPPLSGTFSDDAAGAAFTEKTGAVFAVDRLDVLAEQVGGTVVAFGDSITDGAASTRDADRRYPDWLQRRLDDEMPHRHIAVLNAGIGGNAASIFAPVGGGPSGVSRFSYDVIANPGVTDVIVMLGTNDSFLYHRSAEQIIDALRSIALQARGAGIRSVIGTLTPFASEPQPEVRAEVQAWIRHQRVYDAIVDFEKALEDPAAAGSMDPRYDGDGAGLHPNDDGYRRMSEQADLADLRGNGCFNGVAAADDADGSSAAGGSATPPEGARAPRESQHAAAAGTLPATGGSTALALTAFVALVLAKVVRRHLRPSQPGAVGKSGGNWPASFRA